MYKNISWRVPENSCIKRCSFYEILLANFLFFYKSLPVMYITYSPVHLWACEIMRSLFWYKCLWLCYTYKCPNPWYRMQHCFFSFHCFLWALLHRIHKVLRVHVALMFLDKIIHVYLFILGRIFCSTYLIKSQLTIPDIMLVSSLRINRWADQ